MFTDEMRACMRKVEETRARRLNDSLAPLEPADKQELLQQFHPDYRQDTQRRLRAGPNEGNRVPVELADVLEGYTRIDPGSICLQNPDYEADVLIIGGGGAGAAAALTAHARGADVLLATKLRLGDANTMMAQGGMQASTKQGDSPAIHFLDILGGGGFTNRRELVRALTMDGPHIVKWLQDLGCMFSRDEDGTLHTIHGGGTSRRRTLFAGDYTGAEIMRTLRDELLNHAIPVVEFSPAVELLLDGEGRCAGAIMQNMETGQTLVARAASTIVATGGFGRLHVSGFPTTNHYGATADGLALAYRAGCTLIFLDSTQYHPTGVAYPEQMVGQLVTEKMRGLGAQLVNAHGEQFVYSLETRDAVSSAIIRECTEREGGFRTETGQAGVWLDSPMIEQLHGSGTIERELPAMYRQYRRFGIDMSEYPILVYPTLHYQNGGIEIDERGESLQVPNLFVAGEAAGGIHGRNRLGGNSLLDTLVFGRRAGTEAAIRSDQYSPGQLHLEHACDYNQQLRERDLDSGISPRLLPDYVS